MKACKYAIKQAFAQVGRNKNMSIASVLAITAMMLILGLAFILMVNMNLVTQTAESQFDMIDIYLADDVTDETAQEMTDQISKINHVAEAKYITKDEAMEIMKERWGDNAYLLDGLVDNPFPATIEIRSDDLQYEDNIAEALEGFENIDDIKFYQDVIDKITTVTGYVQTGAIVMIIILLVVSILVVANTVKLTVHAREKEIQIMKYVGATNWFVRGPFFVEGIIIGFISSVIATVIVGLAYYKFIDMFASKLLIIFSSGMVPVSFIMENVAIIFVALGVCIGSIGSILSMRKFLDA